MKAKIKVQGNSTARLIDARAMSFGLAIFTFILVWLHSPDGRFHRNIFMAVLLLAASISLLPNTSWSNLVAAILSGYLPIEVVWEFWMYARNAEVPVFSYRHFGYFFSNIEVEVGVFLFLALTMLTVSSLKSHVRLS